MIVEEVLQSFEFNPLEVVKESSLDKQDWNFGMNNPLPALIYAKSDKRYVLSHTVHRSG